jgi:two-component system NtrC family sensor kinase
MNRLARLASLTSTLSFRTFLVIFLALVLMFSVFTTVLGRFQARIIEQQAKAEAARHGDLLRQALYASMLNNERERTHTFVRSIGGEPGIEAVRIYNKKGEIKFSSQDAEIGQSADLRAEACYVCHASSEPLSAVSSDERARIYRKPGGNYRVLGLITPIRNEESCWNAECHAHAPDQSLLGVLDVQMTMQQADEAFAQARGHALTLAVGFIFLVMLVIAGIVFKAIYMPTSKLQQGTAALARGDLNARIDLRRSDELGKLAESFNQMASSLQAADAELRSWSHTLEQRVRQKTEELARFHQSMIRVEKTASLGKMAATVAHELNNPLGGILTYAKLAGKKLERLLPDGEGRRSVLEHLEMIRSESARCGKIVRDLLTFSRESSAELREERLNGLVERALKLVEHHSAIRGIETETRFLLADDRLVCDPDQIVQALIALMINAVEAMPDGGRLCVTTGEAGDGAVPRVYFSVADTGVGIAEDVRERLFDPFFSTKSETKGVGLGLAVVYGIVQRHEGSIAVDSEVGHGTTFTITIPRTPATGGTGRAQA